MQPRAESATAPGEAGVRDGLAQPARTAGLLGAPAALMLAAGALFFFHLASYGLWEPDEARYAEIAREMLASRDFILPHLNYVPYIEKPPLLYWLTTMCFAAFGINPFAARLLPALSAAAGVLATYLFAARVFDRRRALLAGAILATSPLYAAMAQVLTTDMLLSTALTAALYAFFMHWREGGRWRWMFYAAMGFATLAKGPVGVALPALVVLSFLWWQGDLRAAIAKLRVPSSLALTAAIALPWFVAVGIREPDFAAFYLVGENFRRFFDTTYSHGEPLYYYLPVLVGGMLPWSLMLVAVRGPRRPDPAWNFCAVSALVIVGFFSLASGKLLPYILPALPPIAMLIADAFFRRAQPAGAGSAAVGHSSKVARIALLGLPLGLMGLAAIVVAALAPQLRSEYLKLARPALMAAGVAAAVGGVVVGWAFLRRRFELGLAALAGVSALMLCAASYGRLEVEPLRSYDRLCRTVAREQPGAELICYRRYVQGLPFYARRRVIVVGGRGELSFGARHGRHAAEYFFDSRADLIRLWSRPGPKVLILNQSELDELRSDLGEYRVIASEHRKRAIVPAGGRFEGK